MRAHVYDPFLNTFSDKILEITWNEAYYFTYGFLRYHWLQIAKEDNKKTHVLHGMVFIFLQHRLKE